MLTQSNPITRYSDKQHRENPCFCIVYPSMPQNFSQIWLITLQCLYTYKSCTMNERAWMKNLNRETQSEVLNLTVVVLKFHIIFKQNFTLDKCQRTINLQYDLCIYFCIARQFHAIQHQHYNKSIQNLNLYILNFLVQYTHHLFNIYNNKYAQNNSC